MNHYHSHKPDQSGELIVVDRGIADIILDHHAPHEITVKFKSLHHHAPCNPHFHEEVEWDLHFKHEKYVLVIKWHVSDLREIVWHVKY